MTDPDEDLRDAFRRCRAEDSGSAPPFPGLRQAPARPRPPFPIRLVTAFAAVVAIFLLVRPGAHPTTLAEALPRPLLQASSGRPLLQTIGPANPDFSASDMLLPSRSQTLTPLIP